MRIDQGSIKCKESFRKYGFVSEEEDQEKKKMIRDWVGVREQATVERSQ